jgi:hypothetical protein
VAASMVSPAGASGSVVLEAHTQMDFSAEEKNK